MNTQQQITKESTRTTKTKIIIQRHIEGNMFYIKLRLSFSKATDPECEDRVVQTLN